MPSISWEDIRKAVLRETTLGRGPDFGVYTATSRATGSITVPRVANDNLTVDEFVQCWGFLPDHATADDRERPLGQLTVATGVIDNAGRVFSGTGTSEQFEIMQYLSPTQLFDTCVEAMKQLPQTVMLPLGTFTDSDMETAGVSNWTASSSALSKVTTATVSARLIMPGARQAMLINLSGADGYGESPAIDVNGAKMVYVGWVVHPNGGTASLRLNASAYSDATATGEFGTANTYEGQRLVYIERIETLPANCTQIKARLAGTGATDDIYSGPVIGPFVLGSDLNVDAPSWMDETWRLRKIRSMFFRQALANKVSDFSSHYFTDWMLGDDVKFNVLAGAEHPYQLGLRQLHEGRSLWYEGVRRAYDLTSTTFANTATGEAYTTSLPREQVILSLSLAVCDRVIDQYRDSADRVRVARDRIVKRLASWQAAQELELPPERYVVQSGYGRV